METLHKMMQDYKKQLQKGTIQKAYLGLMEYLMGLRTYLKKKYPEHFVSGFYQGYMDISYFSFPPTSLKLRELKIAIVFVFDTFRFEVWLGAKNKEVQAKYWSFFKKSDWDQYKLIPSLEGEDSILEHVLVNEPDFSDLDTLSKEIESGALRFIEAIEAFLAFGEQA